MMLTLIQAQIGGGRPQAAARAALDWVEKHPGHSESAHILLRLEPFSYPADRLDRVFAAAEKSGSLSASEYNSRAWLSLFSPPLSDEDLRIGRTAVNMTKGGSGNILHTLAGQYAEVGRCEEAKQALDEVMRLSNRLAPTGPEWFVIGRMAEQYGLLDAAERAYRRLEAPKDPDPQDTYWLAVKRLKAMGRTR
jgi:hypothetical protein